jgi:hypothetical protein
MREIEAPEQAFAGAMRRCPFHYAGERNIVAVTLLGVDVSATQ